MIVKLSGAPFKSEHANLKFFTQQSTCNLLEFSFLRTTMCLHPIAKPLKKWDDGSDNLDEHSYMAVRASA